MAEESAARGRAPKCLTSKTASSTTPTRTSWSCRTAGSVLRSEAAREAYHDLAIYRHKLGKPGWAEAARSKQADVAFRAGAGENLMLRKNYEALGAFSREDRSRTIDLLGFASQLVFTTFCLGNFGLDQGGDIDLCYAAASAHNRMMTDFCAVDRRLLATAYVPLVDFARARAAAAEAIALGAKALLVASRPPPSHSPSHVALDPVWAQAQEAGIPVLFHVGGEEKLAPAYFENGLPRVKDFHGGEENFTSGELHAHPPFGDAVPGRDLIIDRRGRPLPAA